jgi:hypothetical protein
LIEYKKGKIDSSKLWLPIELAKINLVLLHKLQLGITEATMGGSVRVREMNPMLFDL